MLNALCTEGDIQVWAEAEDGAKVKGLDRYQIKPAKALAIWTTPPGYWELQTVIKQVYPQTVYLFAHDPGMDVPQAFLSRLAGLTKHVIRKKNGQTSLPELAAATAQREGTVKMGLFWLEAKGYIRGEWLAGSEEYGVENEVGREKKVQLKNGSGEENENLAEITTELKAMLEETAAYRKHLARADKDSLI